MSQPHPDADRLALAALPAETPDPGVTEHLAGCRSCQAHVTALRRTVALARSEHAEVAAPPARVWQAIADELGDPALDRAGPAADERPAGTDGRRPAALRPLGSDSAARPRSRWRTLGVPIAAAVAGIAAGIAIGYALAPVAAAPPSTLLATLRPIGSADPAAAGTVDGGARDGAQQLVIRIQGVSNTEGGDYLEAWLIAPDGSRLVSLGALTRDPDGQAYQGEFVVPGNLPMTEFNTVDISAERWDGNPAHSHVSLLRGSLS